ncbi:hypothetical protein Bhyg_15151, partial [Pseudolycoriella hygida]
LRVNLLLVIACQFCYKARPVGPSCDLNSLFRGLDVKAIDLDEFMDQFYKQI